MADGREIGFSEEQTGVFPRLWFTEACDRFYSLAVKGWRKEQGQEKKGRGQPAVLCDGVSYIHFRVSVMGS